MQHKSCFILDLDGTVYVGQRPIQETLDFILRHWKDTDFYFLSNNTSKTPNSYVQRLQEMGIPVRPEQILTPLDPLEIWVRKQGLHTLYAVANTAFLACLRQRLPEIKIFGPDCPDPNAVEAVVLTYDTELTYGKLARSALLLQRPTVLFLATHPDNVCPSEAGPLPDVGSFLKLYETATGRRPDCIFGKPDPAVLGTLLERYEKSEMVMVGDRLSTDKVLAENAGIDFILVLSGEATREDLATLERQPTLVLENLGRLDAEEIQQTQQNQDQIQESTPDDLSDLAAFAVAKESSAESPQETRAESAGNPMWDSLKSQEPQHTEFSEHYENNGQNAQQFSESQISEPNTAHISESASEPQRTQGISHSRFARKRPPESVQTSQESSPKPAQISAEQMRAGGGFFDFCSAIAPLFIIIFWLIHSVHGLLGHQVNGFYQLALKAQTELAGIVGASSVDGNGGLLSPIQPLYHFIEQCLSQSGIAEILAKLLPGWILPPQNFYPVLMSSLSELFFLLTTWGLALTAGYQKRGAFAAVCVLMVVLSLAGLPPEAGTTLFSGSLILLSLTFLYKGWISSFAPLSLGIGFAFAAVATCSAGLAGLVLPLAISLIFLIWRGTFRRAGAMDGAIGFGIMLVLLCARWAWLALFQEQGGKEELLQMVNTAFLEPINAAVQSKLLDWWRIFPTLVVITLPFPLLIFFLPWSGLGRLFKGIVGNRKNCPGHGWIWIFLICGLALYCVLEISNPVAMLLLLAPLAILAGQGILAMFPASSKVFHLLMTLLVLVLGIVFAVGGGYPLATGANLPVLAPMYPVADPTQPFWYAMLIQAVLCLIFAFFLWRSAKSFFSGNGLLALTVFAACVALPLLLPHMLQTVPATATPITIENQAVPAQTAPVVIEKPVPAESGAVQPADKEQTPEKASQKDGQITKETPEKAPDQVTPPAPDQKPEPAQPQGEPESAQAKPSAEQAAPVEQTKAQPAEKATQENVAPAEVSGETTEPAPQSVEEQKSVENQTGEEKTEATLQSNPKPTSEEQKEEKTE